MNNTQSRQHEEGKTISFKHIQTSQRGKKKKESCMIAVNFPPTRPLLQPPRSVEVEDRFDLVHGEISSPQRKNEKGSTEYLKY